MGLAAMTSLVRRARQWLTPQRALLGFMGLMGVSLLTATMVNIVTLKQALKATGTAAPLMMAVASPAPYQYENQIRIHSRKGTITLPLHEGSVESIVGPAIITLSPGQTRVWDPGADLTGSNNETAWLFAVSDVDGVTIAGKTIGPALYFPEVLTLPLTIVNPALSGRTARVTIYAGINFEDGAGGGGFLL